MRMSQACEVTGCWIHLGSQFLLPQVSPSYQPQSEQEANEMVCICTYAYVCVCVCIVVVVVVVVVVCGTHLYKAN